MIKSFKIILSLMLLTLIPNVYSQFDYKAGFYITNNLDTVVGEIALKSSSQSSNICTFRNDKNSASKDFTPEQIHSYRIIGDKYFISKTVTIDNVTRNVFLEFLVNGCSKLYFFRDQFYSLYFIESDSGKLTLLENRESIFKSKNKEESFKKSLKQAYQNDPKIIKQIDRTKFESKSLIKLVKRYNNEKCPSARKIVYSEESTSNKWLSINAGINHEYMLMNYSSDQSIKERPFMGIQNRVIPKFISTRWDFSIGLNFSYLNKKGDFISDIYGYTRTYRISMKSIMLEVPLKFGYRFLTGKLSAGFDFGVSPVYYFNPEYKVQIVSTYAIINTKSNLEKFNYILTTGLNFYYKLSNFSNLNLHLGYERRKPFTASDDVMDNVFYRSFPISIGWEFKL